MSPPLWSVLHSTWKVTPLEVYVWPSAAGQETAEDDEDGDAEVAGDIAADEDDTAGIDVKKVANVVGTLNALGAS